MVKLLVLLRHAGKFLLAQDDFLRVILKGIGFILDPAMLLAVVVVILVGFPVTALARRRRRTSLQETLRLDLLAEHAEPVLELKGSGRRTWLLRKRPITVARLTPDGFVVHREDEIVEGLWSEVRRWYRAGFADWTLHQEDEPLKLRLGRDEGFSTYQRRRFDRRVALHVSHLPETRLREEFQKLSGGMGKVFRRGRHRLRGKNA